jgi:hypothetical protein
VADLQRTDPIGPLLRPAERAPTAAGSNRRGPFSVQGAGSSLGGEDTLTVFMLQGAITIPSMRKGPDEIAATWSSHEIHDVG